MICFNIFYKDCLHTILEICKEKTVFEMKALISSVLDYEYSEFFMYLGNYGFIDTEDLMDLPLTTFGLESGKIFSLFILNFNYQDIYWKICCTEKIVGNSPISQVGYFLRDGTKIKSNSPVCYACSIYCHPSSNKELVLGNKFSCMCGLVSSENIKTCTFSHCKELSSYLDIYDKNSNYALSNIKSVNNFHTENLNQRGKSQIVESFKKTLERKFDFERSVKFGMQRVKMYESDEIKKKVISHVPIEDLKAESLENSVLSKLDLKDEFVKSLLKWFRKIFFKWCDKPICNNCNTKCSNIIETVSSNDEEQKWLAFQTELYSCNNCNKTVRFPRYNNPEKLCSTKTGRCGEWANLFGSILRCFNYETRFVDNFEDHVWNEYYSQSLKRWIHVDSCETAWDTPLIYEQGWGRNMTFILAYSINGVYDVTRRYVKDWDLIEKRRNKSEVDRMYATIIWQNNILRRNIETEIIESLEKRDLDEQYELLRLKSTIGAELAGRQSGSENWRRDRGEFK